MKCWDMKHILALPTCQKICSNKEPEQIDFGKFDLGHPVFCVLETLETVSIRLFSKKVQARVINL